MTSSVAFSNYSLYAVSDPNNPGVATSNYEIPNRFTFRADYSAYWWGDNRTNFAIVGAYSEGRPFSYTYSDGDGDVFGDFTNGHHLLYVPTGPDDPNVQFADDFDTAAFFDFINSSGLSGYAGDIAPRNAFYSDWWTYFDIRIEQEFPGFREGQKFAAWITVANFCNLLNDDWCVLREASFPRMQGVVDLDITDDGSQYIYEDFSEPGGQGRVTQPSLWQIRVGLTFRF
jgi:hypothetical protein